MPPTRPAHRRQTARGPPTHRRRRTHPSLLRQRSDRSPPPAGRARRFAQLAVLAARLPVNPALATAANLLLCQMLPKLLRRATRTLQSPAKGAPGAGPQPGVATAAPGPGRPPSGAMLPPAAPAGHFCPQGWPHGCWPLAAISRRRAAQSSRSHAPAGSTAGAAIRAGRQQPNRADARKAQ